MGDNLPQILSLLAVLCTVVTNVNSYSKYGRSCGDIGCLPNEVCVIAHDSCNFGQRDGRECGSYPTCTKTGATSGSRNPPGTHLNPAPDNTYMSQPSNNINNPLPNNVINSYNPPPNPPTPVNPHYVFGAPQNQMPIYPNVPIFPNYQPTSPPPFQQFPQANHPNYPPYPGQVAPRTPSNPYNPPYVFGNQPTYHNPQATTNSPNLFQQFMYNKQRNSAYGQIHYDRHHYHINIILITIASTLITSFISTFYNLHSGFNNLLS